MGKDIISLTNVAVGSAKQITFTLLTQMKPLPGNLYPLDRVPKAPLGDAELQAAQPPLQ